MDRYLDIFGLSGVATSKVIDAEVAKMVLEDSAKKRAEYSSRREKRTYAAAGGAFYEVHSIQAPPGQAESLVGASKPLVDPAALRRLEAFK